MVTKLEGAMSVIVLDTQWRPGCSVVSPVGVYQP